MNNHNIEHTNAPTNRVYPSISHRILCTVYGFCDIPTDGNYTLLPFLCNTSLRTASTARQTPSKLHTLRTGELFGDAHGLVFTY